MAENGRKGTNLAVLVTLFVLATATLPMVGVIDRLIAYSLASPGLPSPLTLAFNDSIADLTMTGVVATVPVWCLIGFFALWTKAPSAVRERWRSQAAQQQLRGRILQRLPFYILFVIVFLFVPLPYGLIAYFGIMIPYDFEIRPAMRTGQVTFVNAFVASLIALAALTLATSLTLNPIGVTVGSYSFTPGTSRVVEDGSYADLGTTGATHYLQSCRTHKVYLVSDPNIEAVQQRSPQAVPRPSGPDVLTGRVITVGYRPPC